MNKQNGYIMTEKEQFVKKNNGKLFVNYCNDNAKPSIVAITGLNQYGDICITKTEDSQPCIADINNLKEYDESEFQIAFHERSIFELERSLKYHRKELSSYK